MPPAKHDSSKSAKGVITWRPTKIMNMRDLSKDDDFLSHLLVEKLGTGEVPLLVHKMDPSRKLPKTDTQQLLQIVRRRVCTKLPVQHATRNAVDDLLQLPPIRYYLQGYNQKQINAFATHASRYFELYHPSGCIEIAHTSRYSHRTGKSELCILATRPLTPGQVITELKGSMANLTEEEDKELKRTDIKNIDIRRDFSVIHSKQMKKNHLFLGPARFVNHDCDNNCELFREGKYITFRVIRPIAVGDEITAHYGDGYFGRKNRHCLCETCERNGRGGYNPDHRDSDDGSGSDSDSDSDLGDSGTSSDSDLRRGNNKPSENININERRTRRGVYATVIQEDSSDEESEEDGETSTPLPPPKLEEETPEMDSPRLIASVTISTGLMTPDPDTSLPASRSSPLTPVSPSSTHDAADTTPSSARSTPMFRSIIATRRQKAREAENSSAVTQSATPPLTDDTESRPGKSRTPVSRRSVSTRAATPSANLRSSKGKEKASTPSVADKGKGKETRVKKEEPESRILRARPSAASLLPEDSSSSKPQPICGPDGKPLPMCGTCNNVLPLISVDHKVVWGLEEGSKKSKAKRDCPRCLRHLAIYGQLWPHRIPSAGGSSIPTPKEVTPAPSTSRGQAKSSTSSLSEAKKKYTAKLTAKSGQRRQRDEEAEEPPSKKRKVEKLDIPKPKVEMSVKAKKELLKSTAAARMKTYGRGRSRLSLPNLSLSDIPKRKRGRPRLSPSVSKKPQSPSKETTFDQPRESNGRFGRKDEATKKSLAKRFKPISPRSTPSSRAERAADRDALRASSEQVSLPLKRSGEASDAPRKKAYRSTVGESSHSGASSPDDERDVLPSVAFRGGLLGRPTPHSLARGSLWNTPPSEDETSLTDESGPFTPEDSRSPPAVMIEGADTRVATKPSLPTRAPFGTFKPSPFMFAKRRWSSNLVDDEEALDDVDSAPTCPPEVPASEPVNSPQLEYIEISDSDSLIEGDSISSSIPFNRYHPSYRRWSEPGLVALSTEESEPGDDQPRLMPLDDCSDLSSDEPEAEVIKKSPKHLKHVYPSSGRIASVGYIPPKSSITFTTDIVATPPNLVNAGWDSCSDFE